MQRAETNRYAHPYAHVLPMPLTCRTCRFSESAEASPRAEAPRLSGAVSSSSAGLNAPVGGEAAEIGSAEGSCRTSVSRTARKGYGPLIVTAELESKRTDDIFVNGSLGASADEPVRQSVATAAGDGRWRRHDATIAFP